MDRSDSTSDGAIRKNQIKVLALADGFFQSTILFALLKLNIFERIGKESRSVNDLADEIRVSPETLARLLRAGVFLGLLNFRDGAEFCVAPEFQTVLLRSSGEHYLGDFLMNLSYICSAMTKLDEAVRQSAPTIDPSSILGADEEHSRDFTLAMHNYASTSARELATFLDTTSCKTLLDVGCGAGTNAFNLGMRNPSLELYLLDLPQTLKVTAEVASRCGIENRIHYLPLDVVNDDIPGTYDMILVSNILHMLGEAESRKLLKRLYESINKGGSLVILAHYMRDDHMGARWPVFMDLIQLCITKEGRNHSVAETKQWLREAGFQEPEYNPMTIFNNNSFLRGYK